MNPEAIAEYVKTYNEERRRLARQNGDREKHLTRRAGEIAREVERLVDAIAKGIGDLDTIGPRMKALQQERDQVKAQLVAAAQADQVVTLHPAAVSRYLADIKRLSDVAADAAALNEPELVATLRNLVEAIGFMRYDLGYFDLEQKTLQPLDNPFGTRLLPMS